MAVRPATASSALATSASSHQPGGLNCGPPFCTAPYSHVPAGMARRVPASAGMSCGCQAEPGLAASGAERAHDGGEMPGVEHRRPGNSEHVDRGEHDKDDGENQQHLAVTSVTGIQRTRLAGVPADRDMEDKYGDDGTAGDNKADAAQQRATRPPGHQPKPQQQRNGQPGGQIDHPLSPDGWPGSLGQRCYRGQPRCPHGRNDGRHSGYGERRHDDQHDGRPANFSRTGTADQGRAWVRHQRRDEPASN